MVAAGCKLIQAVIDRHRAISDNWTFLNYLCHSATPEATRPIGRSGVSGRRGVSRGNPPTASKFPAQVEFFGAGDLGADDGVRAMK